jgi:hypothetical protein
MIRFLCYIMFFLGISFCEAGSYSLAQKHDSWRSYKNLESQPLVCYSTTLLYKYEGKEPLLEDIVLIIEYSAKDFKILMNAKQLNSSSGPYVLQVDDKNERLLDPENTFVVLKNASRIIDAMRYGNTLKIKPKNNLFPAYIFSLQGFEKTFQTMRNMCEPVVVKTESKLKN